MSQPDLLIAVCVLALALAAVVWMVTALRRSMQVTLYAYKNIGLSGGILFVSVFAAVLLSGIHAQTLTSDGMYAAVLDFPRRFSYYAVFVILAVSFLVGISNIALIRHEGFRPKNALGLLIAFVYIGGTALIYVVSDLLTERVLRPRGWMTDPIFAVLCTVIPLFLLLMLCYFECIFAGTVFMGWKAARQKPVYDKDFIIILGCSIDKRGGLLPLLRGRVNRAIRFAWEQEIATGKPVRYVPSGGQGANEIMSEGSAMELYLLTRGAEPYEVFPEKRSADTLENFRFSKAIIDKELPAAKVAFATTNYHMLRSGILARKAGLDAQGIAGDTKWYFWPNGFIREFFAILAMNVRVHVTVAIGTAVLCTLLGCAGYFLHF